jgi:ribulose-phosphate 3-epimerase
VQPARQFLPIVEGDARDLGHGAGITLSIAIYKGIIVQMETRHLIAASILAADFTRLGDEIREAESGGADWIHVDVMDGHFVPNLTMGPLVVEACRRATDLPLDVHLMVEKPEKFLKDFANAGASGLTVQVETCPHLHQTLHMIKELGLQSGVALNPATPVSLISEIIDDVDLILVMTVNPGFGGQVLIESTLRKVSQVREILDSRPLGKAFLEVDGGIHPSTILEVAQAGAEVFVAGSAIFNGPSGIVEGVQALRRALEIEPVKK